jgi:hypothetical protein
MVHKSNWIKTGKDEWHNLIRPNSQKFYDGVFITKTVDKDYIFDSYYRASHGVARRFKTKKEAENYAKKYMRKN